MTDLGRRAEELLEDGEMRIRRASLDFNGFGPICRASDDALDAVVAALAARAAHFG